MKEDSDIQISKDFNRLANEFLKLQLNRANDIALLRKA